jgi:hypothetical protein
LANERTGGLKGPVALGASEALKILLLNPNQLAWHGRSISLPCAKKNSVQRLPHAYKAEENVLRLKKRRPDVFKI